MANESNNLTDKLLAARQTGVKGTRILKHRALRNMPLSSVALQTAILLPLFVDVLLWLNFDTIAAFWSDIITYWMSKIDVGYGVAHMDMRVLGRVIAIPYPDVPTILPTHKLVLSNLMGVLVLGLLSFFIPRVNMPMIYLVRASLVIHTTAIIYFLLSPNYFPYDMGSYIAGMLALAQYLIFLIPPLLGLIYYVLDFPLWRKLVVTVLTLGFFILMFPFQYMLYSIILASWTILFMPLLYIMFGPLLNTLMFVSWYSWALTWRGKHVN